MAEPSTNTGAGASSGEASGAGVWLVLVVACAAEFMVVLDASVVNVALPIMRVDLGFSPTGLQWVVNAYTLTYAGFLSWAVASPICSGGGACFSWVFWCSRGPVWCAYSRQTDGP